MNIFPIKNDTDYQVALAEIDGLMDAKMGTPEGDALDIWVTLVENYEAKWFHSANGYVARKLRIPTKWRALFKETQALPQVKGISDADIDVEIGAYRDGL